MIAEWKHQNDSFDISTVPSTSTSRNYNKYEIRYDFRSHVHDKEIFKI